MGRERSARGNGSSVGGIQLPAVAWEVPEPAAEAGKAGVAPAAVEAGAAAVGAAGAVPEVRESGATAVEAAGQARPGVTAAPAPAAATEEEAAGRRIPKPMVAAAVIAGLVLVGVPLGIAGFGGDGPGTPGADGPPPAGFSAPDGGGNGYVPGADAPGNPPGDQPLQPGQPAEPGQPGQPAGAQPGEGAVVPAAAAAGAALPGIAAGQGTPGTDHAAAGAPAAPQGGGQNTAQNSGQGAGQGAGQGSGQGGGAPQTQPQPPAKAQQPAPPPDKPTQPAPPPAPIYHGVAGPGCGGSTSMQQNGWYDDGQKGWRKNSGGYSGDGCSGGFTSMPMSGAANKDDSSNSVVWTFNTGSLTTGSCRLSVYVPNNGDIKAVGGAPTYYTVQGQSFNVNQTSSRGQWVPAGTFPLSGGRIAVVMHSRGQDWVGDSVKTYAHHAASAVKADCTG
ncbi:hypothetical protein [Kitasatospora sp. NPDC059160]|uniref:hypothetical protein n=1 Tax=Kitasatospora sp. NPDC059160 TaxID=3346748 RepID=UPI0036C50368